jgi:hypothetical protein
MYIFRGSLSWKFAIKTHFNIIVENSNWLSSITKKGKIESASRPLCGFWIIDDQQLGN